MENYPIIKLNLDYRHDNKVRDPAISYHLFLISGENMHFRFHLC